MPTNYLPSEANSMSYEQHLHFCAIFTPLAIWQNYHEVVNIVELRMISCNHAQVQEAALTSIPC